MVFLVVFFLFPLGDDFSLTKKYRILSLLSPQTRVILMPFIFYVRSGFFANNFMLFRINVPKISTSRFFLTFFLHQSQNTEIKTFCVRVFITGF